MLSAFCTILPFYFAVCSCFFNLDYLLLVAQLTLFSVLFPHVEPAFSIFLAIYSQSYSALLWLYFCISVHNYACFDGTFIAISTKLRCVLVLIAPYFGAKRTAFWC